MSRDGRQSVLIPSGYLSLNRAVNFMSAAAENAYYRNRQKYAALELLFCFGGGGDHGKLGYRRSGV